MNELIAERNLSKKDTLLSLLNLDVEYTDGYGDRLYHNGKYNEQIEVLDVVGSYGTNLLGYKNKIHDKFKEHLSSFPPNFIQVSRNTALQELSYNLIRHHSKHTSSSNWICEYASTGAEIIDAAIKLSFLRYNQKIISIQQEINFSINRLLKKGGKPSLVHEFQNQLDHIQDHIYVLHFEGSFHGKTLGTIAINGNTDIKDPFPKAYETICSPKDPKELVRQIELHKKRYFIWDHKLERIVEKEYLPIAAIIIEPIQGESGVNELSAQLIEQIAEIKKQYQTTLISDEIQCGLYRTGYISALDPKLLVSDLYCYGKQLGGGLAKIAAMLCKLEVYNSTFFKYHSSTFAEDYYSSWIANQFLNEIEISNRQLEKLRTDWLYNELVKFQKINPDILLDVRGRGNMVAIELNHHLINYTYFTKFLNDLGLLGYWVSSVLLAKENIRILPSLSNSMSFRIQPSIQFNQNDLNFLLIGLSRFFNAIRQNEVKYLFDHILPLPDNPSCNILPNELRKERMPEGAAVFICHPIDFKHICNCIDLIEGYGDIELVKILDELSDSQKFSIYHLDKLVDKHGKEIDIVLLAIPLTSLSFYHALRNGKRKLLISKIQEAVDFANEYKAKTIGLGQYTSIISGNGEYLRSDKAIITTGNAFTTGLVIKAVDKAFENYSKRLEEASISLIGAAGNIVNTIGIMLVEKALRVNLVFHASINDSRQTKKNVISFIRKCLDSPGSFPLKTKLKELIKEYSLDDHLELVLEKIEGLLTISSTIKSVVKDDMVIIGTNDTKALLRKEDIKEGAIVIDIAVPSNTSESLKKRSDITYIQGGVASLPLTNGDEQVLNSRIIPFGTGESYACLAETFGIAFDDNWKDHHTGELTREMVENIMKLMEYHGFGLKRMKTEVSL